jgi:hypothetical protein
MLRWRLLPWIGGLGLAAALFALSWDSPTHPGQAQEEGPAKAKWEKLFNGRSLDGWEPRGGARWTVDDGVLIGKQAPNGAAGDIFTIAEWTDFELEVTFRIKPHANSGVWFRMPEKGVGYQFDILEKEDYGVTWGTIYAGQVPFLCENKDESMIKRDDWNVARIKCVGPQITAWLNGVQTADVRDDRVPKGRVGFQVHGGEKYKDMAILVKEARILPLTPGEEAVSNQVCYVCHMDFREEPLTTQHLAQKVGCATCHGESIDHANDESHQTAPDRVFPKGKVDDWCGMCHREGNHPCTREIKPIDQGKVCTDCHGEHWIEM